jgi:hypothetical protein
MKDQTLPVIGLSVGATTLAAVTPDRSVTRPSVTTLAGGMSVSDFVDRVGDPVGIIAPDGSVHSAALLLADALRRLADSVSPDGPCARTVTFPSHWRRTAVDALGRALQTQPTWAGQDPVLIPDTVAAVTALQAGPGLPADGVVALCDFGGSGSSITLVDADRDYQQIGETVRHFEFSGDVIDQALLTHVVAELGGPADIDVTGTSALGSLTRLRAECRGAKEQLSASTVASVLAELPGRRSEIRITRTELDELIAAPLSDFIAALEDALQRAGVPAANLAAVAGYGGGAAVPAVTTALSERFRVPVITAPRPIFTAAVGVALRSRRVDPKPAPKPAPVVPPPQAPGSEPISMRMPALAWSAETDLPEYSPPVPAKPMDARPKIAFEADRVESADDGVEPPLAWYRRPLPVVAAALIVIATAGAGTVLALRSDESTANPARVPGVTATPAPGAAPLQAPAPEGSPNTYMEVPAAAPQTQPVQAAQRVEEAPAVQQAAPAPEAQPAPQAAPAPAAPAPAAPAPAAPAPEAPAPAAPAPEAPAAPAPPSVPQLQIPQIPSVPAIPQIPAIPGLQFSLPVAPAG